MCVDASRSRFGSDCRHARYVSRYASRVCCAHELHAPKAANRSAAFLIFFCSPGGAGCALTRRAPGSDPIAATRDTSRDTHPGSAAPTSCMHPKQRIEAPPFSFFLPLRALRDFRALRDGALGMRAPQSSLVVSPPTRGLGL